MLTDLPQWTHEFQAQAGAAAGSSLDELSTSEVVMRTLMFLAVLVIVGWFARRIK